MTRMMLWDYLTDVVCFGGVCLDDGGGIANGGRFCLEYCALQNFIR